MEETKEDSVEKNKDLMTTVHRYITKEYRALLRNATLVLSIVMFAVVGFDITLAIIAPSWPIRLFVSTGVMMSLLAVWFLYTAVKHFIDYKVFVCRSQHNTVYYRCLDMFHVNIQKTVLS